MEKDSFSHFFGIIVRNHRKASNITQEKLSEAGDLDVRMVRLIETKGQNLSINVADSVARALGVTLSSMIKEAEELRLKKAYKKKTK